MGQHANREKSSRLWLGVERQRCAQ